MAAAPKDFKLGGLEFPRPEPQEALSATQLDAVARRSASGGVLALFGSLALFLLLWSAWCLGWISATWTSNILVVTALSLSGGYVIQLARFHRALSLPNMRLAGYIALATYWILVAGVVFKGILPLGSPAGGLFSLLLALEALIFYLTLREARQAPRALTLAISATILHLLGWLLALALVLEGLLRYMDLPGGESLQVHYFPFPPILDLAHALQNHLGAAATLALAEAAILLAALLRVHFHRQVLPKRPGCSLLNPAALAALALFVVAALFAQGAYHHIHSGWSASRPGRRWRPPLPQTKTWPGGPSHCASKIWGPSWPPWKTSPGRTSRPMRPSFGRTSMPPHKTASSRLWPSGSRPWKAPTKKTRRRSGRSYASSRQP